MTTLVLDNPELLTRATLASGLTPAMPGTAGQRPHRMKFHFGFNRHALDAEDVEVSVEEQRVGRAGAFHGEFTQVVTLLPDDVVRGLPDAQAAVRVLEEAHARAHGQPQLLVAVQGD